ncbi:Plasminogen activator inhibitor 1 RNA-binding protein [Portunus trituberculatus]|uniref:Plasminogen activator inhibitor 1 RNA-binding protein n=1 Tax=Portunus trituberculatus TaxID=210409 RepID=A0A5B7CGM0_PORTR|nr:Plasminogen activator inhibitor 1 RNA-binding protein [Portunus trituberculatus]
MENSYGIGVRNRYELFYDEDIDPMDLIKQTEKIKDKSSEKENKGKTTKAKAPVAAKKGTKTEPASKAADKTSAPVPQQRGPRPSDGRVKFSDREERNNRRNRQEGGEYREGPPPPRFDGEGRGGGSGGMGRGRARGMGRGRGRGRGGPGGIPGGMDNRGKREFDRQSGMATTGVKPMDKREGSGSFNWGSDRDQIEEQLNATPNANELDTSTETPEKVRESSKIKGPRPIVKFTMMAPEEGAAPAEGEEVAKEDDNAKEMTLDEWKAMQGTRNKPSFNIRAVAVAEVDQDVGVGGKCGEVVVVVVVVTVENAVTVGSAESVEDVEVSAVAVAAQAPEVAVEHPASRKLLRWMTRGISPAWDKIFLPHVLPLREKAPRPAPASLAALAWPSHRLVSEG